MIEEAYCSFEVAKLLKEKGFDGECFAYHLEKDNILGEYGKTPHIASSIITYSILHDDTLLCPSQSMAMKWLREVQKLTFIISPQWAEGDMRNPCRWYWEIRGLENINIDVYNNPLCNTYEEAVEAALKYCLENLI